MCIRDRVGKEQWDALPDGDKTKYEELARQHREDSECGKDTARNQPAPKKHKTSKTRRKTKRRRVKSSYDFFLSSFKKKYRRDNKDLPFDDKAARKAAREEWQNMSSADKEPYEEEAKVFRTLHKDDPDAESSEDDNQLFDAFGIFRKESLQQLGKPSGEEHEDELEHSIQAEWDGLPADASESFEQKALEAQRAYEERKMKARSGQAAAAVTAGNIGGMINTYQRSGKLPQTTKLTYALMVKCALYILNEPQGSSTMAITRFVRQNYKVKEKTFKSCLLQAINKLKECGAIQKSKSSFKFTPAEAEAVKLSVDKAKDPRAHLRDKNEASKKKRVEEHKEKQEVLKRQKEELSLIHISEPTRLLSISYAVFCLKKKKYTIEY
eukprot:TRINITY_DN21603_c0_g2_i2.p1 TRINITY_DN21603_c0_g2~~TRINITY_DN21603_c0_g2_i2.p1  ORF type:complete len:382 (-),score=153.78 TRINITY_DN21603_c0_g2_i2:72-1217(-)